MNVNRSARGAGLAWLGLALAGLRAGAPALAALACGWSVRLERPIARGVVVEEQRLRAWAWALAVRVHAMQQQGEGLCPVN